MPSEEHVTDLNDATALRVTVDTYPIKSDDRMQLIELLEEEWERGDMDWLLAMRGAYSDALRTLIAVGFVDDQPVGTASVSYPVCEPEVCVVEGVMTSRAFRGRGIAAYLTGHLVHKAFDAGCRAACLGNTPSSRSVYEKIGFTRISGAIMRCAAPQQQDPEADFYARDQKTQVRETSWGDMPGVACLMGQSLDGLLVDYLRGLVSHKYVPPIRCVSNFTTVRYDVKASGGSMFTLVGASAHRVLGFASITPGPAPLRNHVGIIDAATHDHYAEHTPALIDRIMAEAPEQGIAIGQACVAATDAQKASFFEKAGFRPVATIPDALRLDNGGIGVVVLQRKLS